VPRDQFFQFSWRPRAPTLLPKEQETEIAKHLKDYSKRYDEIDSKLLQEVWRSGPAPPVEPYLTLPDA
jgi:translation initiation factor 3 subunit B